MDDPIPCRAQDPPCQCRFEAGHEGRHECGECNIWWTRTERGLTNDPNVVESRR